MSVNLKDFIQQLDCMFDEWSYYIDRTNGELLSFQDRYLSLAEELEADPLLPLAPWEQEEVEAAKTMLNHWDDMIRFPDKRELDEYGMMEDFIETLTDPHQRECFEIAISGRGAFRRFKDTLPRFGLEQQWYRYKDEALFDFARKWCEENSLSYTTEDAR